MTDAPLSDPDPDDALAAEYVQGGLNPADRAAAEARIARDPGFALRVTGWKNRRNGGIAKTPPPRRSQPLLRRLSGMALAAVMVLAVLVTLGPPERLPVALLATADNRLAYEVTSLGDTLHVARVAGVPAVEGQVHQLWVIAPGEAPVSLGLLQDAALIVAHPMPIAGWVLAVSVEPAGGSPTAQPTGPVILTAKIGA